MPETGLHSRPFPDYNPRPMPYPRFFITVLLLLSSAAWGGDPVSMRLVDGQWQPIEDPSIRPADDPVLQHARQLLEGNHHSQARRVLVRWLKQNRQSPLRDQALMMMARAYYQHGNRIRSFFYLDELMDTYPASALFHPALQMQYRIADAYLDGYKNRFLFLPILPARNQGIEMLYRIQQRAPGSELAEKSMLRTGDFYFADGQFDLAQDVYAAYARSYQRSPEVPRVLLQRAYAALAQFRGTRFDATPIINARTQLIEIAAAYPDLARENNVAAVVAGIDRTFSQKLYRSADYYRRTHEPRAAVYMYRYLLRSYPDSPEADDARNALERMPEWALNEPPPSSSSGYAPVELPTSDGLEAE